jgi:cation transport ATPase
VKQRLITYVAVILLGLSAIVGAADQTAPSTMDRMSEHMGQVQEQAGQMVTGAVESAKELSEKAKAEASRLADEMNKSERAQNLSAGLLQPIYLLAEALSFSAFHWVAFALMFAGVVSFGLQLILAKLVVLSKAGFSLTEIISDATCLAISLIGLVLTTQAATENSSFTSSPVMVLSAALVGGIFGFMLYLWGQAQEVEAVKGRSAK